MSDISLHDAIFSLRAMRRLKKDPVPEEDLRFLIEAATQAASGHNGQGWGFIIVRDAEQRRRIGEAYLELAARSVKTALDNEMPEADRKVYQNAWRMAERLVDIPALIVCCMRGPVPSDRAWQSTYYGSIYPAIQNLMLAARSRGLGTLITTLHLLDEKPFRDILELPDDVHTTAIIPVGYPEGKFGKPLRDPAESVTHWDRWSEA
jgi:nitroreductase